MKKSKVIVPALGILVLSTAAAVSGTVAWFSATKNVSVSGSNFVAVNPSGGLSYIVTGGANTTTDTDKQQVIVDSTKSFRDASVNVTSGALKVYSASVDSSGTVSAYKEVSGESYPYDTKTFYAATWAIAFTSSGSESYNFDLYFDGSGSTFSDTSTFGKCFRVAFYDTSDIWVWAPNRADNESMNHVTGLTTTDIGVYNNCKDAVPASKAKTKAEGQALDNFLCTLKGGETKTYNFVAWYEGEDAECKDKAVIPTTAATMALKFSLLSQNDDYKAA